MMIVAELDVTAEVTKLEPANEVPELMTCEAPPTDELAGDVDGWAIEVAEADKNTEAESVVPEMDAEVREAESETMAEAEEEEEAEAEAEAEASGGEVLGMEPSAVIAVHVLTSWTMELPLLSVTGVNTMVHVSVTGPLSLQRG